MAFNIDYKPPSDTYDEMQDTDGRVRPHWRQFLEGLTDITGDDLTRYHHEIRRLLKENGVTYNVHGDLDGENQSWDLDPIPLLVDCQDWSALENALAQRAELLNLILIDLYGPRQLIAKGLLPPELIYSPGGLLRQCDQISLPGSHQLVIYAADVARGSDNRLCVLSDLTQVPIGAGYSLENRTAMARVFPDLIHDCQVKRLANYFRTLRSSLAALAPEGRHNPRIVVLTPGPKSNTYFEHAYLAAYHGYTLVQGDDLTVRDGFVWLKSIDGLQRVDPGPASGEVPRPTRGPRRVSQREPRRSIPYGSRSNLRCGSTPDSRNDPQPSHPFQTGVREHLRH